MMLSRTLVTLALFCNGGAGTAPPPAGVKVTVSVCVVSAQLPAPIVKSFAPRCTVALSDFGEFV